MSSSLTYESAFEELREITEAIESEQVSVDELAAKVKRSAELIEFCTARLRATEAEVNQIIQGMDSKKEK
jgi:exodeoxyribonuclease VII small subunit